MNQVAHQVRAYPGFISIKQLEVVSVIPWIGRMLVHLRVTPSSKFAVMYSYTWVERGTVRAKCLALEHDTMSLVRVRTQAAQSGGEHTNHEATMAPCS